jgi:hypothetical protein
MQMFDLAGTVALVTRGTTRLRGFGEGERAAWRA